MSKTTLAETDGFTPLIDNIVEEYGVMTAAVFGRIWRYCQMENGVCNATLDKMAGELKLNRSTFIRHIEILEKGKFIKDHTPTLRNKPHTYSDTGKAQFKISISGVVKSNTAKSGGAKSNSAVAESDPDSCLKQLEDSNKIELRNNIISRVHKALDHMRPGCVTYNVSQRVNDALDTYPEDWILEAIAEAEIREKRNWAYIEAILRNWETKGRSNNGKPLNKMSQVEQAHLKMGLKPVKQVMKEMGIE